MAKRPTLQDVADRAGVSLAAVSYALRGVRGSPETIRRVQEAADELGYLADPIAQALASGRTRTVAILCGAARDPWQQALSSSLSRALLARGRHAIVADADGDAGREFELLEKLQAQRPDGLLVAPLDPFAAHWRNAAERVPVVAIGDRLTEAHGAGAVVFDNDSGMRVVFDHLVGLGHRRVVAVLPERPSTPDRPAEQLIARHAERCDVDVSLLHVPPATADSGATVERISSRLSSSTTAPTAAFCLSDSLAYDVLRAAAGLGWKVPDHLAVVGFENHDLADLAGPGLTSVDWGGGQVVDAAVNQLLGAIDGQSLHTVTIGPRLVVRGSTAPAPDKP